jgi:N-acetylglucosaminyldiphosphoundecaprenol N-acetyl-beta-D-mannosaminyltransferase
MSALFLPRAPLADVVLGRAPLVGPRTRPGPTGRGAWVSPLEPRLNLGLEYGDPRRDEHDALTRSARPLVAVRTLVLAALTAPLAFRPAAYVARPYVVSTRVDNLAIAEAVRRIVHARPIDRAHLTHFVHPHALNLACDDRTLRGALARADLVLPDGVGLRLAAKLLGAPLIHNVNGTDLLPLLLDRLAREGRPVAFVGAAEGVARRCAERACARHPGLKVALVAHGHPSHEDVQRIVRTLRSASDPPVVLVGMGTPIQERFVHEHLASLAGLSIVTVGALFDFHSGRVPRAPLALRESGLEWAHRLWLEPRRLAGRYLVGNPLFLARAVAQRLRTRPRSPQGGEGARRPLQRIAEP